MLYNIYVQCYKVIYVNFLYIKQKNKKKKKKNLGSILVFGFGYSFIPRTFVKLLKTLLNSDFGSSNRSPLVAECNMSLDSTLIGGSY